MSNERTTVSKHRISPVTRAAHDYDAVAGVKPGQPDIINLEIDENDDFGSDPYNRTGSHCILKIGEDS